MSQSLDDVHDCRGDFLLWSRPSTDGGTLAADGRQVKDSRRVAALCRGLEMFMEHQESHFGSSNRDSPLLVCVQSDATSHLARWRKMLGSKERPGLQRQSHDLCEYLNQRLFLATPRGSRVHESLVTIYPSASFAARQELVCMLALGATR